MENYIEWKVSWFSGDFKGFFNDSAFCISTVGSFLNNVAIVAMAAEKLSFSSVILINPHLPRKRMTCTIKSINTPCAQALQLQDSLL